MPANVPGFEQRPRVLHVFADPATGVKLVGGIAQSAAASGFDVEMACNSGELLPKLHAMGFRVWPIPMSRRFLTFDHVRTLVILRRLIKARNYDIIHTHTPVASFIGRLAARLSGTRIVIYHMRGSAWERESAIERLLFTVLERLVASSTTLILTVNCEDAADAVRFGICPKRALVCLHCGASGIEPQRYDVEHCRATERSRLAFTEGNIVIGFIGRFVREKGLLDLLAAFKILSEDSRVRLLLVGGALASDRDQSMSDEIADWIRDSGLSDRIVLTGFREDVPELLAAMDIVVQPSHREGFANVLAEGGAARRPVVGANTRGVREVVVDGQSGFIVPARDSVALAGAIQRLVESSDLRAQMAAVGRRRAETMFSRSVLCEKVVGWYRTLLDERG